MEEILIELDEVTKQYQTHLISGVTDINLRINKGDILTIVGESGSGKSTLLKLIYGLISPQKGFVTYRDKLVLGPTEKLIPGHDQMKMVTQEINLNLYAKVFDNISAMLSNADLAQKKELTWQTMEFLGIDKLYDKKIVELSGGEQQRVALARAVITEPEVLLLDEPFSQIDAILRRQLRADIERLNKYLGITIIMVTHDAGDGLSLSDQMMILKAGRQIGYGAPKDIYNDPKSAYVAQLIGKANIIKEDNQLFAVYRHQISLSNFNGEHEGVIKAVYFNGYFEEIIIGFGRTEITTTSADIGRWKPGNQCFFSFFEKIPVK